MATACDVCMEAAQQRDKIGENVEVLKQMFTYLTHVVIIDYERNKAIGYLSQDHKKMFRFDTQQWRNVDGYTQTLSTNPLIIKNTTHRFKFEGRAYNCPGISKEIVK